MAVSPSGPISKALNNLRTLLSNCAAFKTLVGAADAAAALASIHLVAVENPTRPFALIAFAERGCWTARKNAGGAGNYFRDEGSLMLLLEQDVAEGTSTEPDAGLTFANALGDIAADILELAGTGTYLSVTGVRVVQGPQRSHRDAAPKEGDYYQALLQVDWAL